MAGWSGDFPERELYEEALRRRVCARCAYFGGRGACRLPGDVGCAFFQFLPEIVEIVTQSDDTKIENRVRTVRNRLGIEKELAPYLPQVIEAVEEVQARIL